MALPVLPNVVQNLNLPNVLQQKQVDLYNYHMALSNLERLSAEIVYVTVATGVALAVAGVFALKLPLLTALGMALIAGAGAYAIVRHGSQAGFQEGEVARALLDPVFFSYALEHKPGLISGAYILAAREQFRLASLRARD